MKMSRADNAGWTLDDTASSRRRWPLALYLLKSHAHCECPITLPDPALDRNIIMELRMTLD